MTTSHRRGATAPRRPARPERPPEAPAAVPRPIHPAPPLDVSTVRALHGAIRASLRLRSGLDPGWTWTGTAEREFLRAVRGHHVGGLIAPHWAELGMPAGLGGSLTRDADRVALRSLAHAGLLRQVHDRLDAAGIPMLFFKGLAVEAQTGRPLGERGGGDIDVWIPRDHVEAAMMALRPEWTLPANYPQPGASWAWRHWQRWGSELTLHGPLDVPFGRTATPLSTRVWATVLQEQRLLGPHTDRIGRLSRPAYLHRLAGRRCGPGRHLVRDSLALLWFLAVAPPHQSGTITTTSPVRGAGQAVVRRFRYERDRARHAGQVDRG